jgi:predicted unusual protein kinase regulating ubiquinone biosynthesis (AarF/ABC1/UbiB family)
LQQEAPPHPWKDTEAVFKEAFGDDWSKYLTLSQHDRDHPLGSGCVAQVECISSCWQFTFVDVVLIVL